MIDILFSFNTLEFGRLSESRSFLTIKEEFAEWPDTMEIKASDLNQPSICEIEPLNDAFLSMEVEPTSSTQWICLYHILVTDVPIFSRLFI